MVAKLIEEVIEAIWVDIKAFQDSRYIGLGYAIGK